jgi:uncharacterized phage protein (TIGR01671 family)
MSRRIKFRIWFDKTKAWIHGPNEVESLDGVNLFGEMILFGELIAGVSIEDLNEVEAFQFTGKKDKNGKEIFEGDILKAPEGDEHCVMHQYCHVWYDESSAMWIVSYNHRYSETSQPLGYCSNYEVVGNVCDTPELIK